MDWRTALFWFNQVSRGNAGVVVFGSTTADEVGRDGGSFKNASIVLHVRLRMVPNTKRIVDLRSAMIDFVAIVENFLPS